MKYDYKVLIELGYSKQFLEAIHSYGLEDETLNILADFDKINSGIIESPSSDLKEPIISITNAPINLLINQIDK